MRAQHFIHTLLIGAAVAGAVSCKKNDDNPTPPTDDTTKVYALGVGVTTTTGTSNYVVQVSDLMSGTVSLTGNGLLQDGYRDYHFSGGKFYSIGGLGVTDVNTITLDASNNLTTQKGLTFDIDNNQLVDLDGTAKTLVGISSPSGPTAGENIKFYTVDVAANTVGNKVDVPVLSVYDTTRDWIFHTGMQVRGNQVFQTFYPVSAATYATQNTDTNYVAIYSYPGFALQKVIKDGRTGPSGAFNTRSGLFKTESGDLYAVSTSSYSNGYSQSTKPAGILKIAAGATEFDGAYYFNTDAAPNGGKIAHAIYIGSGKLFAAVTTEPPTIDDRWSDGKLSLAIVDLVNKTITRVANSPVYKGDGGRSFATLVDNGKVYTPIFSGGTLSSAGTLNIYETDIATATATKGATIQATFVGGIARMK